MKTYEELLDTTENAMLAARLATPRRQVAFVDGAFGGMRVVVDPTETMQELYDRCDPKTQKEIKRRGWL